ncbi:MAG: arginine--tRNA ligase [Alphaproteobacteria bacterium]|jgi:arginyl-tRNA synthetase|nr:arginine--tRNA ligase [Alphaproteobacteria bacterium]
MTSLAAYLTGLAGAAFAAEGLPPELGQVTVSNRPDLGQFQCNGALPAAKAAKTNPRQLAEGVAARLRDQPIFADVSLAGPGFINLTLTDAFLAERIAAVAADPRLGVPAAEPETVLLDYGGPNVAKPMHVGHLRASIIGESLKRLARFVGHAAIGDVHLGDWGTPMGMLISELAIRRPDLTYFDPDRADGFPANSPVSMADLEALYPEAAAACKADPARMDQARRATAELQAGRPGYVALWRHFVDVSVAGLKRDFGALGVEFDLWNGEADVHALIDPMVTELRAAGIAEDSEGAVVVRVARDDDRTEVPPLILIKSDGAVMYGTTDLATIIDRQRGHSPHLVLYVVDQRQHLHFEQVFRAAGRAGYDRRADGGAIALEHIGFGTMNGPDGKPFRTRAGGVMKLHDLIEMATGVAYRRLEEEGLAAGYPEAERAEIARMVGLAAIKFADLSNHRTSNYVFDLERFTRFEGRTGPYLQYAAVRIRSLLRKAAEQGFAPGTIAPPRDVERDLVLTLGRLPDAIAQAWDKRAPNELTEFAFALAQEFSRFYANCHILSETDAAIRDSRLALAQLTLNQLVQVLDLLGITVPDRM